MNTANDTTSLCVLDARVDGDTQAHATLTLPFELRQKARQRAHLDNGHEVALMLSRGDMLRDGDLLTGPRGLVVQVRASEEAVSQVQCRAPREFARAAYHLGNRHVALQIGDGWLRYLADHVLDDMIAGLGLEAVHATRPFEPEAGAYAHHHRHHEH